VVLECSLFCVKTDVIFYLRWGCQNSLASFTQACQIGAYLFTIRTDSFTVYDSDRYIELRLNFINVLHTAFMLVDPKSVNRVYLTILTCFYLFNWSLNELTGCQERDVKVSLSVQSQVTNIFEFLFRASVQVTTRDSKFNITFGLMIKNYLA